MNELALFSGAGGGILGGHLLGWRTVCAVEWEEYPASVLCARQNDKILPTFPIWDDVRTFDGRPWRGIAQVVSGGFPCQDISSAGKGVGITGERSSMWKHMARIIGEVQPQHAFVENSPMLTIRGLGVVLGDLAEMGFDARWCVLGADSVGAPHKRDRIWILATNARGIGRNIWGGDRQERHVLHDIHGDAKKSQSKGDRWERGFSEVGSNVANPKMFGQSSRHIEAYNRSGREMDWQFRGSGLCDGDIFNANGKRQQGPGKPFQSICAKKAQDWQTSIIGPISKPDFWKTEPPVGRVVDGVASRVDELKALGNGQVPLCVATAWKLLTSDLKV